MMMMNLSMSKPSTWGDKNFSWKRRINTNRRSKWRSWVNEVPSRCFVYFTLFLITVLYTTTSSSITSTTTTRAVNLFVNGQEKPFATVQKFNRTVSYRTNICDRQQQLYNGTLELPDALRGLNLSVSITNYSNGKETFFFALNTDEIDEANPGVFALVLDELATRAGFTWRNSFVAYPPLDPITDGNQTWTDILSWAVHTFDISMERWAQTVERLEIPVSFPISWYDNSIVLGEIVKPSSQTKQVFYLWSFLDPFHFTLWLSLLLSIAITGIVYYILELWNNKSDELELECKPIASIFYAAITFTGHYELRPQTHPARLVGFSFTFWALIVGSAYTANLASFLVSPRHLKFKYSSIDNQTKAHVCVQKGGAIGHYLSEVYPNLVLVPKTPDEEIFKGLRLPRNDGGCDVLAHQFNTYEIYENLRETNDDCNMRSEKRIVHVIPAGLATAVDTGSKYCTSLISHVLDYYLTTMIDDGFLERMWKSQLDRISTVSCASNIHSSSSSAEETTFSLTIQDVGGIFIIHVILSILAIAIATIQFYLKHIGGHLNDENRTLSTAFGIAHAKQAIESRFSIRDLSLSTVRSSLYNSSMSKLQRSNPDFKNGNIDENHIATQPNGVDVMDETDVPPDEQNPDPTTTPTNSNSNNSPYHSEDLLLHEDEIVA